MYYGHYRADLTSNEKIYFNLTLLRCCEDDLYATLLAVIVRNKLDLRNVAPISHSRHVLCDRIVLI